MLARRETGIYMIARAVYCEGGTRKKRISIFFEAPILNKPYLLSPAICYVAFAKTTSAAKSGAVGSSVYRISEYRILYICENMCSRVGSWCETLAVFARSTISEPRERERVFLCRARERGEIFPAWKID